MQLERQNQLSLASRRLGGVLSRSYDLAVLLGDRVLIRHVLVVFKYVHVLQIYLVSELAVVVRDRDISQWLSQRRLIWQSCRYGCVRDGTVNEDLAVNRL